jgi:hypothetical protein
MTFLLIATVDLSPRRRQRHAPATFAGGSSPPGLAARALDLAPIGSPRRLGSGRGVERGK